MDCKAVLFDLDGTLLDIDMELFLQQYFQLMVSMARERNLPVDNLPQLINEAVQAMIVDRNAQRYNYEVFDQHFFPHYHSDEGIVRQFLLDFYEQGFPKLQSHCAPFPIIPEIVEMVFAQGKKVVIATNSLYPLTAIEQRLSWARVGHHPYDLITTYENMHFTKPHLEYYQEICSNIGVEPTECLVIGNDVGEDIIASRLGMKTFLLTERLIPAKKEIIIPDHQGNLTDLYDLVARI